MEWTLYEDGWQDGWPWHRLAVVHSFLFGERLGLVQLERGAAVRLGTVVMCLRSDRLGSSGRPEMLARIALLAMIELISQT